MKQVNGYISNKLFKMYAIRESGTRISACDSESGPPRAFLI